MTTKLEAQMANVKRELPLKTATVCMELEDKLAVLQQLYDEAEERRRLRREIDSANPRETLPGTQEWEYQDMVRERCHDNERRQDGLVRDVSVKEERIANCQRVSETESQQYPASVV
jgi:hypothetical protein